MVLANGLSFPVTVGFAVQDILVTTDHGILRATNSAPAPVVPDSYARGMVIDDTNIYWADIGAGKIRRLPRAGGTSTDLLADLGVVWGLAGDVDNLYTVGHKGGDVARILRIPKNGAAATSIATDLDAGAESIAVDGEYVYWLSKTHLMKMSKVGGAPVVLATGEALSSLAVDNANVYTFDQSSNGAGKVLQIAKDGANTLTLNKGESTVTSIAADSGFVYFAAVEAGDSPSNGWIFRVPVGGGPTTLLASNEVFSWGLVVKGGFLYWAQITDGVVKRLAL